MEGVESFCCIDYARRTQRDAIVSEVVVVMKSPHVGNVVVGMLDIELLQLYVEYRTRLLVESRYRSSQCWKLISRTTEL